MDLDKTLLLRPAIPIIDAEIEQSLVKVSWFSRDWLDEESSSEFFFNQAKTWIQQFLGGNKLSDFTLHNLTSGTTGAFQDFYQINQGKKLKVLKGEYPFHRDVFESLGLSWAWLEVDDLNPDDFVILSIPFSGDGEIHPQLFEILNRCEQLKIPVMIDCAFAGLSDLVLPNIDGFQCVKKICFSLSKVFNLGGLRCGFEFSRYQKGANYTLTQWDYGQKVAAYVGMQLMKQFPLHFIFTKYREHQIQICQQFKIQPSSTVLFGLGDNTWKEYSRDGFANRICLSEILKIEN